MNDCDMVGGVCYEQISEKTILLIVLCVAVIAHIVFIVIPLWLESRKNGHR